MARGGETRTFRPHDRLLVDVIRRQAGTLSKAIAEGVMNSADAVLAGKTPDGHCHVTVTEKKVRIVDNGKGFRSRQEVEQFFEVFGQPHEEGENKTFGTFRMGRGQLFAYGKNVWRTGKFRMTVDVVRNGLNYKLEDDLEPQPGCVVDIDLENPLSEYELNRLTTDLGKWFKYAPVAVVVNRQAVSQDPAGQKWDLVTDEAYIRLSRDRRDLSIYNLGVFVADEYGHTFGAGGDVVSRKALTLNFARNQVMSDCPVWGKVTRVIRKQVDKLALAGKKLTADQVSAVLARATAGDRVDGLSQLRLIADCNGRRYTYDEFETALGRYRDRFSFARAGDPAADRLLQTSSCLVLDRKILEHLGLTSEGPFLVRLAKAFDKGLIEGARYVEFEKARVGLEGDSKVLDEKEQSALVQVWLDAARRGVTEIAGAGRRHLPAREWGEAYRRRARRLLVGESPTMDAWTDGKTYVVVNRAFLERLTFNVQGVTELGVLLAHELAHDDGTIDEHHHGVEFYEEFEYLCREGLPQFVSHTFRALYRSAHLVGARFKRLAETDAAATERGRAAFASAADGLRAMLADDPAVDSPEDPSPSE